MDNGLDSILAKSGSLPPSAFTVQRQSIIQPGADTLVHFEPSLGAGIPDSGLDWDLHYNFSGSFHLDDPKPGSSHVQNLDDWWSREVTQTISDVPIGGQEGQYQAVEDWWNREAAQTVPESRKGSQKGQHEAVDDWWNREVTQMDSEPVRAQEGQDEAVDDVPPNVTVEKPSRSKLSPHAKRVLENFFRIELYPDMKETETIARVAEMTFKQVRQWFRNKRRRTTPDELGRMQDEGSKDSIPLTESSLEFHDTNEGSAQKSEGGAPGKFGLKRLGTVIGRRQQAGDRSFPVPRYSASSHGSSCHSGVSNSSRVSKSSAPRKGRRRWQASHSDLPSDMPFRCTFCWKEFSTKYSWKRHEESVHVLARAWTCHVPDIYEEDPCRGVVCPYCYDVIWKPRSTIVCYSKHAMSPYECLYSFSTEMLQELHETFKMAVKRHLEIHNHELCASRPDNERTFYRKEHIRQHLLNHHRITADDLMPSWVTETYNLPSSHAALGCPFCSARFENWPNRVDHVASHFLNGDQLAPKDDVELSEDWIDTLGTAA